MSDFGIFAEIWICSSLNVFFFSFFWLIFFSQSFVCYSPVKHFVVTPLELLASYADCSVGIWNRSKWDRFRLSVFFFFSFFSSLSFAVVSSRVLLSDILLSAQSCWSSVLCYSGFHFYLNIFLKLFFTLFSHSGCYNGSLLIWNLRTGNLVKKKQTKMFFFNLYFLKLGSYCRHCS